MGTIVPEMGTQSSDRIGEVLFGRTRRAVLALLYGHADEEFYLRQIIRAAGVGQGSMQRELEQLVGSGLVLRRTLGRQVYFKANPDSPIYKDLRGLLLKTAGVADVLQGVSGTHPSYIRKRVKAISGIAPIPPRPRVRQPSRDRRSPDDAAGNSRRAAGVHD